MVATGARAIFRPAWIQFGTTCRSLTTSVSTKGWIPERFPDVEDRKFSFLHIDIDLYEPTRDSVAFFYPRMSDGGIILCDDYGSTFCSGATKAIDEYLADKPEKMISLSGGGGFLIKGCPTAMPYRL